MLLRPYRSRVIAMFVALVAGTAASLAPAPLAKTAIDSGILKGDLKTLDLVVLAFIASALIVWGASYAQTYLVGLGRASASLADLRIQILRHLQEMPVGFYERRPAGVLISRMTNDVEALDSLVTDTVVTLFSASLTLIGSVAILLFLDVQLALITFLIFPVMLVGSLAFRVASADAYRRTRETVAQITAYLQESLSGIRVVKAFAQEPRHRAEFRRRNEINRDANLVTVNLNAAYFPLVEFVSAIATVAILIIGGHQVINGDVEIGVLVGFIAALNGFFDPIGQLSQVYTTYQSGMAALDKIFELLDEQPELTDKPDAGDLPPISGEIRFDHVSFAYSTEDGDQARARPTSTSRCRPGRPSRSSAPPARASRRSPSSSRASTTRPSGRVLVDGHDLRDVRAQSLRAQMGIVPQEAFLFSGTLADNIGFGREGATREEMEDACRAVGAWDFIEALHRGPGHRGRRARRAALGRPAPARGLRPRAGGRPAHPRARRGDLERRPAHRGQDRGRHAPAARRAHRDRDRPPPLDDPPGRAHRGARARPDRRAGHPRRAHRGRRRLRGAVRRLGRAGRGLDDASQPASPSAPTAERSRRGSSRSGARSPRRRGR